MVEQEIFAFRMEGLGKLQVVVVVVVVTFGFSALGDFKFWYIGEHLSLLDSFGNSYNFFFGIII